MNNFLIGTFFTTDTPYKQVYEEYLKKSINKWDLDISCSEIPNQNSWYKNVAEKPKVILNMLGQLKDLQKDSLVFLDSDATIERYPQLFHDIPEEYDIAFHYLNWETWYGYRGDKTRELLTGTMFFRPRKVVEDLCKEWYNMAVQTNEWEQKCLARVIKKYDIKIYELPVEYCFVATRPQGQEPLVKCEPVVLHHQKSREFKRRIR